MNSSESTISQDSNSLSDIDDPPTLILKNKNLNISKLNDSLISKMSKLKLNESRNGTPLKFQPQLITATDHPLMGAKYPDVVPTVQLEMCSTEFQSPLSSIDLKKKNKFLLNLKDTSTPQRDSSEKPLNDNSSSPNGLDINEYHSAIEYCDSPSKLKDILNFELPIEMSSNVANCNTFDSPILISDSNHDNSNYKACIDPYNNSVSLRQVSLNSTSNNSIRRKIKLPLDNDSTSLDSISICSNTSDEVEHMEGPTTNQHLKGARRMSRSDSDPIPEYSAAEEYDDERSWLRVPLASGEHSTCDMKVIEPYKRVLSHGGYAPCGSAIIVFSACHLPHNCRSDYNYVMNNLFLYVIWTLDRLVTDEYILIYLHGSPVKGKLPGWRWLHECYKLVDLRLRKNLKHLYLVHPTFWLKTLVILCKPFISSKFFRKLSYVRSLEELYSKVPVEPNAIPDLVKGYDSLH